MRKSDFMAYNPENPTCPKCGSPMRGYSVKLSTQWICVRSPDCDGMIRHSKHKSMHKPPRTQKK
jgi:ssDNA-binding Zn-finger/Zn-ribbon topoisomerase 1